MAGPELHGPNPALIRCDDSAGLIALSALFLTTLAALSATGLTATLLLSTTLILTTFVLVVWHCRNSCRFPAKPDNINRG